MTVKFLYRIMVVVIGLVVMPLLGSSRSEGSKVVDMSVQQGCSAKKSEKSEKNIFQKVLSNGIAIIVRPVHSVPKVCVEIWYRVGSKNEKTDQKGVAHLIEHMVFKGTSGKKSLNLSESDINIVVHMLSGSCNAFTSHDYTGYLFNFPSNHWPMALTIAADCMRNCSFKDELLNSEMKAVVQELKMYRDNYVSSLLDEMLASIFTEHPYHDPVIGYKHNLWSFNAQDLRAFYIKHYVPNNAALIVVGDVDPEEVFALAQEKFGEIPADTSHKRETFHHRPDICSKRVTLYRDINLPLAACLYGIPGTAVGNDSAVDVLSWIIGQGKGSRLQRILVDELRLVTSLASIHVDLFDYGFLGFLFEPKDVNDIARIEAIIQSQIDDIVTKGLKSGELERAIKNAKMHLYDTFEDIQRQAGEIGKYFVATGNPEYLFTYLDEDPKIIGERVASLCKKYLRSTVVHSGLVKPLPKAEKDEWRVLQEKYDEEDKKILETRARTCDVEGPSYAKNVRIKERRPFAFPRAKRVKLSNGATLLFHHSALTPKVDIVIDFKAKHFYDPDDRQGLCNFVSRMLTEGTKNYTAAQLADALESRGISFRAGPGGIAMSLLGDDLAYGLRMLTEIVTNATFDAENIEKIRAQIIADIKNFWDEPRIFAGQLVKEIIYKNHPYSKDSLGTLASVAAITRDDLVKFYKDYVNPQGASIAIVGNVAQYDVAALAEQELGSWRGPVVADVDFPSLEKSEAHEVNYPINRDQIVLCFMAPAVAREDKDFDFLLLFDQIFGSGALGSMASRLFQLREKTGLFYTAQGSLTVNACEQPGFAIVKSIVSVDRLVEAEKMLKKVTLETPGTLKEHELEEAKRAIVNAVVNNFESNAGTAQAFLFLERYKFPSDYFDKREEALAPVTVARVEEAARKILDPARLVTLRIGRVDSSDGGRTSPQSTKTRKQSSTRDPRSNAGSAGTT